VGAIESLLCALVADAWQYPPWTECELMGQGLGNMWCVLRGYYRNGGHCRAPLPVCRSGARQRPWPASFHALVILLAVVPAGQNSVALPADGLTRRHAADRRWTMSEVPHVLQHAAHGPRPGRVGDCDLPGVDGACRPMVPGVGVGLACWLSVCFIKRMADLSRAARIPCNSIARCAETAGQMSPCTRSSPLFFAAADKALSAMSRYDDHIRFLAIDMQAVPEHGYERSGVVRRGPE